MRERERQIPSKTIGRNHCCLTFVSRTTELMENPTYIRFSSYWHDVAATGLLPFAALVFFNARIFMKVCSVWYVYR